MTDNPTTPEESREAHLLDYWRTIWRGRWTVLNIFIVVVTLTAVATFTQKPIYRARATVEISPQPSKVSPVAEVAEIGAGTYGYYAEERYFNTQYEIIRSRDVAQRVFDRLDLYNHPAFRKDKDGIGSFSRMVDVQPVKETGIVVISIESPDPAEAASWVNTTVEAYVDRNLDQAAQVTGKAVKALLKEIDPLKERLQDSQKTSFEFAQSSNLYVPENQQKITNDRLSTLQGDLTDTQVKRAEVESILHQVDTVRQSGGNYESIPEISNDKVVQDLYRERVGLEREYEKLLVTYKDKHVRVLETQSEIDKINQKITGEADRIINNLKTQDALLRDREDKLRRSIEETRMDSLRTNQKASSYDMIRGEATETKRIYDLISARIKEIGLSSSLLSNNLRILDRAQVPGAPVRPNVILNLAAGILLGLILGIGTVFFLDYMDNTIRTSEDVERFLKLNLLAVVPKEAEGTGSAVKEAYQTLRTSLLFSRKSRAANAILVTSAGPMEGKSCTTVNIARTLAAGGEKVIVLDCDLRRPTIHQRLQVDRDRGITNYILASEGEDWRGYVKPTDLANLYAITCGPIPPNPADVFGHERFRRLLKELREQFDWVFIDSPPVVSLADATILASLSDMVAFVVKHNENDKELIRRCVNNIRKVNPSVIGAVLNFVDLDRAHYKDYYYVGYYYYGESGSKPGGPRKGASTLARVRDSEIDDTPTRSVG
jgi:polysaccharide biosynthesis transport protein